MNNDPRRRLSRPEVSGISAIFNPRKLRRNSTAVTSQLLGATGRHPSVVVTDDNFEVEFGPSSSMIGGGGGMANGPHNTGGGGGGGSGVGASGLAGGGVGGGVNIGGSSQGSSVPLLSDAQLQGGGNSIVTIESTLINSSQQLQRQQDPSANNNNTNLKPIAKTKLHETIATIRRALFSKTARKLCCGLFLSILVGCCWTIMFHAIKRVYVTMHLFPEDFPMSPSYSKYPQPPSPPLPSSSPSGSGGDSAYQVTPYNYPAYDSSRVFQPLDPDTTNNNNNNHDNSDSFNGYNSNSDTNSVNGNSSLTSRDMSSSSMPKTMTMVKVYDAPFFTAWVLTICTIFFYPIHQLTVRFCSCMGRKGPKSMSRAVSDAIQGFRERGMTLFQFIGRCTTLCFLWVLTNWLIAYSLKTLKATEVLTLFATTTSFLYLLSWVVLHQQFVGLRILAVILSSMGIALFAYMDGQTYRSKTITGVVVGATAAGTSAVFKVSLKKSFGFGATISQQVALIFSVVGIISIVVLWPIFLLLYFTGIEVIIWSYVPWELILFAVASFLLVAMLDNFGVTCTFEFFITIGLLMAIPFSAVLDVHLYKVSFDGMCLAGIIVIGIGFCIVLLPENWPDYITRLIRRFHGPTEEEKPPELPSRDSAMPRLSRAGLENHFVNPAPPTAGYSPQSNSISVSSAQSLTQNHPSTVTNHQQQNNLNQYTTSHHNTNTNHAYYH